MSEQKPGQKKGLESEASEPSEAPPEGPVTIEKLYGIITKQNNAILLLTGKMAEMSTGLQTLEAHQDQSDAAIIEVAKKAGGGGGGGGGANLLAQIMPYLTQQKGQSPIEKIAMKGFLENLAFSTLTTRRIARKAFGDEYTKMVTAMEAEIDGGKGEGA